MLNSQDTYKEKYEKKDYGLRYPDGHIIRFYERILRYKLNAKAGNLLDFGCGTGTHSAYFKSKGYECFGIDIVKSLKQSYEPNTGGAFHFINANESFKDKFKVSFNLIFANQSLYYLPKQSFKDCINEFYDLAHKDCIIFATMMSKKNYYFKEAKNYDSKSGLWEVSLKGRLNEKSFINFVDNFEDLQEMFKPFKKLFMGEYDSFNLKEFEGSAHHFIYIGKK